VGREREKQVGEERVGLEGERRDLTSKGVLKRAFERVLVLFLLLL
jgi:hypothetical protein